MSDLGTRLKQAREARGLSLNEIATATKISPGALEALERNEYTRLPGGIFSRSFVRAYALAVGLDPEATVNEFLVELNKSEREAERLARERRPEISQDDREFLERQRRAVRWLRVVLLVIAIVALSLLVYQGWQWWQGRNATPTSSGHPSGPIALVRS
jgi:cytoskeletal protein RodZ